MTGQSTASGCIIQVLPAIVQGGVERGTVEIATALKKEGIPNCVISSGGKMVQELERIGVEHITLPIKTKNPLKMWLNSYRLEKIFKAKNAALVHVRSRAPAWSVKWACERSGIPFIGSFHGTYSLKPAWIKKPYNRIMTTGKVVIAVSSFIKRHLMTEYQIPEEHIRLIPRGADIGKFNPDVISKEQIAEFAKEYDIPLEKPIVTLAGRLSPIKGHLVVLEAIKQMKNQDVTLLFVGGNPVNNYEEVLKQKIAELPESVSFRTFSLAGDKMPLVLALTDVYLQPTLKAEAFGRGAAEAQAMGCIVVAAAHGGACEVIEDGVTGFLTPVGDAQATAAAIDKALSLSPEERQEMSQKSIISVRQNFSIQKMCERTLAVYREILK